MPRRGEPAGQKNQSIEILRSVIINGILGKLQYAGINTSCPYRINIHYFFNGDNCTQFAILFIVAEDALVTIVVDDFCKNLHFTWCNMTNTHLAGNTKGPPNGRP